jgi:hypothetical protein
LMQAKCTACHSSRYLSVMIMNQQHHHGRKQPPDVSHSSMYTPNNVTMTSYDIKLILSLNIHSLQQQTIIVGNIKLPCTWSMNCRQETICFGTTLRMVQGATSSTQSKLHSMQPTNPSASIAIIRRTQCKYMLACVHVLHCDSTL